MLFEDSKDMFPTPLGDYFLTRNVELASAIETWVWVSVPIRGLFFFNILKAMRYSFSKQVLSFRLH